MAPKRARMARPAAAKVMMRPAARVRRGAAKEDPFRVLCKVEASALSKLGALWLKNAKYYGQPVDLAGKIVDVTIKDGQVHLEFKTSGTQDEKLLRELSGRPDRMVRVHVCEGHCLETVTGSVYLRGSMFKEVNLDDQVWFTNLKDVSPGDGEDLDEMEKLRERMGAGGDGEAPKEKAKKKKEKKRKKSEDDEKASEKKKSKDLAVGQKNLSAVFSGTGLDPDADTRSKVLKKARRVGQTKKKKKKKRSNSEEDESKDEDSRSTTSDEAGVGGIFDMERKVKVVSRCFDGSGNQWSPGEFADVCRDFVGGGEDSHSTTAHTV